MGKAIRLLLVGALALGVGVLASYLMPDRAPGSPAPTAATNGEAGTTTPGGAACFDYNGSLPGLGWPWLKPLRMADLRGGNLPMPTPKSSLSGTGPCAPGTFLYARWVEVNEPGATHLPQDPEAVYFVADLRLGKDGCPIDMLDVYRRLIARHPTLGGTQPRHQLTTKEAERIGLNAQEAKLYFTDDPVVPAREPAQGASMDALLDAYARLHVYRLAPIPSDVGRGGRTGDTGCMAVASPTPTPAPAPSGERRRYRITVSGYENALPSPVPDGPLQEGVRFDYRLLGEFELVRATPSKPWTVAGRRVVTADLKYKSLYPADRCQVTLKCLPGGQGRACRQLHNVTTLRLRVRVDGDDVIVSWGAFKPQLEATGTCTDPSIVTGISYESDEFQKEIGGERMPIQDSYVSPEETKLYQGRNIVSTSFTYDLQRLP